MRMFERSPRRLAVVLKEQDVAKSAVVLQVEHAVAVGPQHFLNCLLRQRRERAHVIRRFDDHFVGTHSVHPVEQAFALAVQAAFDSKRGKFIRHYADRPAGRVLAAAVPSIGQNFRWSLTFIPGAERTHAGSLDLNALAHKIHGTLASIGRNNYPAARNRILAKFRQTLLLDLAALLSDPKLFLSDGVILLRPTAVREVEAPARAPTSTIRRQSRILRTCIKRCFAQP